MPSEDVLNSMCDFGSLVELGVLRDLEVEALSWDVWVVTVVSRGLITAFVREEDHARAVLALDRFSSGVKVLE
ncbi:hypothetical protein [Deinococcus cellulosilyticus]|uniref:Uncharacterized protein n=1 Tax=Deinococcus cellulosilyticus (strain DSM 18568 / NBRC 106333 / KACC 11606 / 5516J-15) TaxID=1223518 RepID=A0A511NAY5_DEIC1|nr:hypothetical protein [Deinococcus cellulosilyticus]GEM49706.1 hypothetical protein DC3_53410 [Deinococcus cellulosilyticus NBRC 106333 = KACC 11606]